VSGAAFVAAQICKAEEQKGHRSAARLLRGALNSNGPIGQHNGAGTAHPASVVSSALVRLTTNVQLADVVLAPAARRDLDSVVHEWQHRDRLHRSGIAPRSKLLFYGPPGCGKSFTARALARELDIPAFLIRFDAVIGAYLGQTAIHLRQLFHFAETTPCVLLLDELDALGKRRGNPLDVGELDRIVIALMQELEHSRPLGLIIGTSNLPKHLDGALWRRFDLSLAFRAPPPSSLRVFAKRKAADMQVAHPQMLIACAAKAKSFADAESLVIAEARRQALSDV
jgi:AAA+ superfamily predicted ATPase